jgi:hypothetical protein
MSETKINDGGPAFPVEVYINHDGEMHPEQTGPHTQRAMGATLRDWFAANTEEPDDLAVEYAEAITGREQPHKSVTLGKLSPEAIIENIKFWAEAQARYRYIMADAMLAARVPSPSTPTEPDINQGLSMAGKLRERTEG